ncbi:hypothetical protein SAY86_013435 [Trapa natans]|uniref:Uncharacterized protein n=1 Tax=Trapa natans TaxID=22666 RepID=A0AAN7MG01_TRANT|nr:hypothetical protein SAY86_013435 [Trapa natans]
MRCKRHLADLSSAEGVCASCLRERLLQLIDKQARADETLASDTRQRSIEDRGRLESQPPQPTFPRSVSPYVARRKSDARHSRFYSTPQVGPVFNATCSFPSSKKKLFKFSLFRNLFRSRSEKIDSVPSVYTNSDPRVSPPRGSWQAASSSYSSPSWLSFLPGRRQKQPQPTEEIRSHACRRPCRISNRGMSPERGIDSDVYHESGYSPESSPQGWRKTPLVAVTPAAVGRKRPGHTKSASGITFCLSPLVRASPSRLWNQKGGGPQPEIGFSGEMRSPRKPYLSTAASFSGNRSRKLADLGRGSYNR